MSRTEAPTGPTLEEIRSWPAAVSVEQAALALGVSRAHAYECIKSDNFPARSIRVGGRVKVITSSILAVLDGVAA
jgi:predicted DNA-binding transcriptional regulator AlpA